MSLNCLVSIIVPVYNSASYLKQCVDSILVQSYEFWECILIDDGSTDSTAEICDAYAIADCRIKVIHKINEGVSVARNVGIGIATGELITFVDADDGVEKNYLMSLVAFEGYDLVYFPHCQVLHDRQFVYKLSEMDTGNGLRLWEMVKYLKNNEYDINFFGFTWNKIFKKSIIDKYNIRFIPGLKISEDELFTLNYCLYVQTAKVINTPLYNYRFVPDGLTRAAKSSHELLLLAGGFVKLINQVSDESINQIFLPQIASLFCEAALKETSVLKIWSILVESRKAIPPPKAKRYLSSFFIRVLFSSPILIRLLLIYIRKIKS